MNPDHEDPIKDPSQEVNFYKKSVADRVPLMIRNLVYIWIGLVLIGCLLVSRPKQIGGPGNSLVSNNMEEDKERESLLTMHEKAVNKTADSSMLTNSVPENNTAVAGNQKF